MKTKIKMRTKSHDKTTSISLKKKLKDLGVDKLSNETGFKIRQEKKITGANLILSYFDCCFGNSFSLTQWAIQIGEIIKETVSKQAVSNRVNQGFIKLVMELVNKSFTETINKKGKILLGRFKNVYVQDSTCLALPDALKTCFKGNFSRGKIKSVAKLQVIFNLAKGCFISFDLTAYAKNDQAASKDILPFLKKDDLVIRDLGYFVINVLQSIKQRGAEFVTRLRTDVNIYNSKTGKQLKLKRLLKNKTFLKKKVLIGSKEKMEVILMAIKTTDKIRGYRKLKALKDRDKRKTITIEKLKLLGWDVFVCSIDDLTGREIREIYRLRWQIEIIFKSWKSHLRIEKNISQQLKKPELPCAIIYLTLLMVVLILMPVYWMILSSMRQAQKISLLKITKHLIMILSKENWQLKPKIIENIIYHSSYEKRNRSNIVQNLQLLT